MLAKIFIASANPQKAAELKELTEKVFGPSFRIEIMSEDQVEETGTTLRENAMLKVEALFFKIVKSETPPFFVLADDTALEVGALEGEPGLFTARYAGESRDFMKNKVKLLDRMQGFTKEKRQAKYRSALAIMGLVEDHGAPLEWVEEGDLAGYILEKPKDLISIDFGVSYDSIFCTELFEKPVAYWTQEERMTKSQRLEPLRRLRNSIEGILK